MQGLSIEWRHYDKEGATCDRCAATGTSVREVVAGLSEELADKGISVIFTEKKLPEELMAPSNAHSWSEVNRHIGFMDKADLIKGLKAAGLK